VAVESGNWRTEALVGAVVVAAIGALVWFTFSLGGGADSGSRPYVLLFDSALGLSVDNTVAVAGVRVGVVEQIAVDGRQARVTVRVDPAVTLYADARAAVRQKTLLGEKFVDLDPGNAAAPGARPLAAGAVLRDNVPTVEIDAVIRDVSVLVARLNNITPPLESAIARIDDAMKEQDGKALAGEVVGALHDVRALVRATNKVVASSGDDLQAVLALARDKGPPLVARLDSASARLDALLGAVDPAAVRSFTGRVGPAAEAAATNLEQVTSDMKVAMLDVRDAARRIDGVLARVDSTLKRLDAVNETAIREFLQVQGVRVNLIPDAAVTNRIKKLREESVPLPE
jgi:phospholipid/cholesterol/gamma-HCH transport system substrate-binding protein